MSLEKIKCLQCGKVSEGRPGRKFCNKKCYDIHTHSKEQTVKKTIESKAKIAVSKSNRVCEHCGCNFRINLDKMRCSVRFCSVLCRNRYFANKKRKPFTKYTCKICKKSFFSKEDNREICSKKCNDKNLKKVNDDERMAYLQDKHRKKTKHIKMLRGERKYRPREILSLVRKAGIDFEDELAGQYPTAIEWVKVVKGSPSIKYIVKSFGSWSIMLKKLKELPPIHQYGLKRHRIKLEKVED